MPCQTPFRDDSAQLLLFKIASCIEAGGGGSGGVISFNSRTGVVTLTSGDVTGALGFTPLNTTTGDARYVLKAGDTMTGALVHPLGTAAAPSDSYVGDLDTGVFSPGADSVGVSTGGTLRFTIASAGITSTVPILFPDGTAAAPSISFASDPDTGIYRIGANSFGSSAGGSLILATSTTGINLTTALAYQYNSVNVIRAQTALNNFFFAASGNLTMTGTNNIAIGVTTLSSNTTGNDNVAIGSATLVTNTTGNNNLAIGSNALFSNTTGSNNVTNGYQALILNTTGSNNLANGFAASFNNTTGGSNTANGSSALFNNTTSSFNTASGANALRDLTTPATGQNTAVGYNTGRGITTGNNNTIIGANVTGLAAALSNNIILADGAGVIRLQIDSSGNTTLAGTLATGDGTAALPAKTFSADLDTGFYRIGANSIGTTTNGVLRITTNATDVILATAFRLAFASGANTRAGNAVLVAGTVTVANTSVTANTIVIVTRKISGGTIGFAVTYTVIAATSFTLTSDSALDTSTYSYILIENP